MQLQYDIKITFMTYLLRLLFHSQKCTLTSFMKFSVWNVSSSIYNVIAIWGWGINCKLVNHVTREHIIGGRDFSGQNFCPWIRSKSDSMLLYCKSWIKYHKLNLYEYFLSGIKFQIVVHKWSLFHPWKIVKFNPGNFIDWKFTNDISWMLIHNMKYCLLSYFVEFILLMSQIHFPKSWSQFELTILPNEWQSSTRCHLKMWPLGGP
jgi:hypothetical protein